MNILIYTHTFAPKIGGVQTYVMLLAEGIADYAKQQDAAQESAVQPWVTVVTPTPADGFDDATLPFRVVREINIRTLWNLISKADVVQLAGPTLLPLFFGLIQRKSICIEHHGYQAACPNGLLLYKPTTTACPGHFMARRYHKCLHCNSVALGWLRSLRHLLLAFFRRLLCYFATVNLPISYNVQKRLQFPRSQVIYYGITDPFAQELSALPVSNIAEPTCFAYVGRLVSEKGLPLLLEAAHRVKEQGYDFRIRFVGDGPERQRLEDLSIRLDLHQQVIFTSFVTGEELQHALEDVAAVVMPSIWEETAGLSAIEQMMRGRLVIAANIGGLGEIVDGFGLRFPMGDVDALAGCLKQVLDDPTLVKTLGQVARTYAIQYFHQDRMIEEHLRLYVALMQRQ
jgi:glycosyltransferase involved in cell wall biosynthesis